MKPTDPNASDGIWNHLLPDLPERSRLYSLEPIGLGTGEIESVTSYISRLAIAHTVSTWTLLSREIGPKLFDSNPILRSRLGELVATTGSSLNGENDTSRKAVCILASLTCRTDLRHLTMAFCRGYVSSRFLVGVKQIWCPQCLAEWKAQSLPIYWPLLWQIMAVKVCPKHGIPFEKCCPVCKCSFFPVSAHTRPGYCPRCYQWLGLHDGGGSGTGAIDSIEREHAVCLSDFLRDGQRAMGMGRMEKSVFPENVELLLQSFFQGNIAALARFMKVHRSTIIGWKNRTQAPTLLLLADLSQKVRVSPEALLCRHLQSADFEVRWEAADRPPRKCFVAPPKVDLEKMRRELEEAASDNGISPASLSQIAARLGCRQTTLQRRFSELVEKVKDRYQKAHALKRQVRAKIFRSAVRSAVIDLHKAGYYPSQHRVKLEVPEFIDMRDPVAYDEWKCALAELGLLGRRSVRAAAA